jgi:hypothetical protein
MHLHLRPDRRVGRWRDCGPQYFPAPSAPALIYPPAEIAAFLTG